MELPILLDVAIGLTVVYLGASLFATIVNEYISQFLQLRGKQLADNLRKLIDDPETLTRLKQSPALAPFFESGARPGSYVDPNVLAQMLVGGISAGKEGVARMEEIIAAIERLPESALKSQLKALAQTVGGDVTVFVKVIAQWVDRSLTMLGEGYRRRAQTISFVVGLFIAVSLNIDTLAVTAHIYRDKDTRLALADVASAVVI